MKDFIIEFTEIVTYKTIIQAESIDDAEEKFIEGEWDECDEISREYGEINSITPDYEEE